jgi:hypothetical protein
MARFGYFSNLNKEWDYKKVPMSMETMRQYPVTSNFRLSLKVYVTTWLGH